jgi:hypothetical protein
MTREDRIVRNFVIGYAVAAALIIAVSIATKLHLLK